MIFCTHARFTSRMLSSTFAFARAAISACFQAFSAHGHMTTTIYSCGTRSKRDGLHGRRESRVPSNMRTITVNLHTPLTPTQVHVV